MSNYVDLHVHSYFSDGTMSPEEILKKAKNAGVSVLAITDHDVLDGSRELLRLAEDYDINCISGVELDVVEQGVNFHVLAYNIDLNNHRYDCVKFPEMKEVCDIIHNAGGKAILAHPGKVIRTEKSIEFKNILKGLINKGIDGIECYYPSHTKEIADMCQEVCRQHDLIKTTGSDCHGDFEDTLIGQLKTKIYEINIFKLI